MEYKKALLRTTLHVTVVLVSLAGGFEVKLTRVSTIYLPNEWDGGDPQFEMSKNVLENFVFDRDNKIIYAVGDDFIHVIDARNASDLRYLNHFTVADTQFKAVEVCQGHVFVSYVNEANLLQGGLLVYRGYSRQEASLPLVNSVTTGIGSEPGMLAATSDCTIVVTGENRGRFVNGLFRDPPGNIAIVRFPTGFDRTAHVLSLDFTAFDDRMDELSRSGVRWVYRGNSEDNPFSNDVEPEYVTFNDDFTKAYVSLQENNAVAEVDMINNTIKAVRGLGFKQWGELDPSDEDGGIHIATWPILGMYLPDGIQWVNWKNEGYIVTANEGNSKTYDAVHFDEDKRGAEFDADEIAPSVSQEMRQALADNTKLGRLDFSSIDGKNSDGKFKTFYSYGGRSFSIYRASDMYQVYDSGSELEKKIAELRPDMFNSDVDEDDTLFHERDKRSDTSGPEPETIAVAKFGLYLVIFVGLEKPGGIAVYSVLNRMEDAQFQLLYTEGLPAQNRSLNALYNERKLFGVEVKMVRYYADGLADFPALLMGGAECGTISVLRIDVEGAFCCGPCIQHGSQAARMRNCFSENGTERETSGADRLTTFTGYFLLLAASLLMTSFSSA